MMLLLASLGTAFSVMAATLPTVSVDLRPLDSETYKDTHATGIYAGLLVHLLAEQLAFVDTTEHADFSVSLSRRDAERLVVSVTTRWGSRDSVVPFPKPERRRASRGAASDPQVQLGIIHAAVMLVRQLRQEMPRAPAPAPAPVPAPAAAPAPAPPERTVKTTEVEVASSGGVSLDASVGVLRSWSTGSTGLQAEVGVSAPRGSLGIASGLLLHRPWGLPGELGVIEVGFDVGVISTLPLSSWLSAQGGLALGVWYHGYNYADAREASDSGYRLDPLTVMSLALRARPTRSVLVAARVGALVTLHAIDHRAGEQILWQTGRVRLLAGLGISWEP